VVALLPLVAIYTSNLSDFAREQMTLREFLDVRERELLEEIERLRGDLSPKEAELAEVRRAKAALGMGVLVSARSGIQIQIVSEGVGAAAGSGRATAVSDAVTSTHYDRMTMKQLVVKALAEHFHQGANTRQLLEFFRDGWDRTITRASLTPQLSRLLQERVIGKDGKRWFLLAGQKSPETEG
jgi:hypothetical protein